VGSLVSVHQRLYSIEELHFEQRHEGVEWWTGAPVARDYLRLLLSNSDGKLEALAFVNRVTGQRYLYAIFD
jgi:hypothetical protein